MADVYETMTDGFTIRRTLSDAGVDARRGYGAVRGVSELPAPIAVMKGPANVNGPTSQVGAGDWWVVDIPLPQNEDIAWVLVSSSWAVAGASGAYAQLSLLGQGVAGSGVTKKVPLGSGALTYYTAAQSAYQGWYVPDGMDAPPGQPLWLPIDPDDLSSATTGALTANFSMEASGAATINANTTWVNLELVRLIGYPRQFWDNGAIFTPP